MNEAKIAETILDEYCPVCKEYKDFDDHKKAMLDGKLIALYYKCSKCGSEYQLGRSNVPDRIPTKITKVGKC